MKTSNGFLRNKCQIERGDQVLVLQARDELADLSLLWVFGGEQAMQRPTNLPVVFTKRCLYGSFPLRLSVLVEPVLEKVGQRGLQMEETRIVSIRTEQPPVRRFLQHLWPAMEGQVGQCKLLLQMLGVVLEQTAIKDGCKGCQAEQQVLGFWREIAVGVVNTAQDALRFVLGIARIQGDIPDL